MCAKCHACITKCTIKLLSIRTSSSMRGAFVVVLMGSVQLVKLLRDFRRGTTLGCPFNGCIWSVVCRVRSVRLATALMMYDGAIPANTGRVLVCVGFMPPVIIRQVSFSTTSSFFACVERSPPGRHTLQLSSIALDRMT